MKTFLRKSEPLQEAAKHKHLFQVGGKCCQRLLGIFCRPGNEQRSCRNGSIEGAWARECSLQGNLTVKSIIYLVVMTEMGWVFPSQLRGKQECAITVCFWTTGQRLNWFALYSLQKTAECQRSFFCEVLENPLSNNLCSFNNLSHFVKERQLTRTKSSPCLNYLHWTIIRGMNNLVHLFKIKHIWNCFSKWSPRAIV